MSILFPLYHRNIPVPIPISTTRALGYNGRGINQIADVQTTDIVSHGVIDESEGRPFSGSCGWRIACWCRSGESHTPADRCGQAPLPAPVRNSLHWRPWWRYVQVDNRSAIRSVDGASTLGLRVRVQRSGSVQEGQNSRGSVDDGGGDVSGGVDSHGSRSSARTKDSAGPGAAVEEDG